MAYKEKVQEEIKEEKLKNLWEEICKSYEEGGVEQIKSILNYRINEMKKNYERQLENLKKIL